MPDLFLLVQSVVNQAPLMQCNVTAPISVFTGMSSAPPLQCFFQGSRANTLTLAKRNAERPEAIENRIGTCQKLRKTVQEHLERTIRQKRESSSSGKLLNFEKGDFVLVARTEIFENEKMAL